MKKRMSILIVVLLVLILIFSSFANAYANPLVSFAGSKLARSVMTTVISGMLIKDFAEQSVLTFDSVMNVVDVTKWYIGQHSGGYGVSVPEEDIIAIARELTRQLGGYGNDSITGSETIIYNAVATISSSLRTNVNIYGTAQIYAVYPDGTYGLLWGNSQENSFLYIQNGKAYISYLGYDPFTIDVPTNYPYMITNGIPDIRAINIPVPAETWDNRYLTETGPNFDGWMEQPGNRYVVNVPTTTDGLGNLIVDDVALDTMTPDLARVSDRLTELQEVPVNDVETWNPVPPTTNPVTDPITDVASENWLDRLWSKFVDLFVLPDDYFIKNFQYLKNEVPMMAFPLQIINDVERMSTLQGGYLDDIWADGWGGHHKIVDFQFLRDMLPTFHNFLRGIMFILLLMYNYDQVYKLIRGNSYGFGHSRQEIIPQQIESPFKSLGRS